MPKSSINNSKGFTLIELLVVILVIGALSGVLLGVVNNAGVRQKARDAQRKADLKKIQTALELFFADNRSYPATGGGNWEQIDNSSAIESALETNYIDPVPLDPSGDTGGNIDPCQSDDFYRYNYRSDGSYYFLTAIMEVDTSAADSLCSVVNAVCGATFDTQNNCYLVRNP